MLILLPPSEGKAVPRRGQPLDLAALSSPALTGARREVLDALVTLCREDPAKAAEVLGLSAGQADLVERNAGLPDAPSARADRIYTGVLYDALDVATLSAAAKRRASARVAVASSLFGTVRLGDRIPSYRLSGDASLPGVGPVAALWREALPTVMTEALGRGLLVDLRSGMYANFWRPGPELATRVATVRVLHEHNGTRKVVSHFNKATKGRIVRALLEDGADPRTPAAFADTLRRLGWTVEVGAPGRTGTQLDVVVGEL
ncbi:peroxide stress protein YaaA [Nocardioides daeguensis]|uniref:Peroxide stress protein YaaA n=1 Tax=Nocardioides daeguensis TaxID=908359 RepID=A0ABP6VLW8_9ACTN|nr:peroxide stress protein YaaA [Nocardioides daeguensis]MBV6727516.1 peroxide stress protein YaaA [Nocardioides daeguensis]MCR1773262.1 peroxide stress protein YaaA [Nocardioides daeguensis]